MRTTFRLNLRRTMKATKLWNSTLSLSVGLAICLLPKVTEAADKKPAKSAPKSKTAEAKRASWADFVEPDFPFFSSVLDARKLGEGWPTNNLTPRGIILPLGNDCWVCFDTDLLRISAIWEGKGITPVGMAQGSYHVAGVKAPEGQEKLPEPIGKPWLANGIYPGWQTGVQISFTDPRSAGPDIREVGRGPINPALGRFKAIHLNKRGAVLEYEVAGTLVQEWWESQKQGGQPVVQRCFNIGRVAQPLTVIIGRQPTKATEQIQVALATDRDKDRERMEKIIAPDGLLAVRVLPSSEPIQFRVALGLKPAIKSWNSNRDITATAPKRWPETITTRGTMSEKKDAYVVDNIALPLKNPWKRNVRLADIAFFSDGRAAAVTFDGDVWMISGLRDALREVRWRRFTSGLHEPLSICVRDDDLFVFDRNGIWRLRDTDGDGQADLHELFSNAFAQTTETREFAASMRVAPDGSFIIAKGGQQSSTSGIHNGNVLRVSPDGRSITSLAWGLRQPFAAVNPKTGLITASDQQGHYIPTTPLHIIQDHQFYGFPNRVMVAEKQPTPTIATPLTLIPHTVNASGAGQVWLTGAKMGSLNDELIHIGYYRPEIFLVLLNRHTSATSSTLPGSAPLTGAAVLSLSRDLEFAPLNGAVNPADGQLYLIGFQIWGTTAKQVSGLARYRYTGAPSTLPREVVPMDKGVLLRFYNEVDAKKAIDVANFSLERWNYKRTPNYGSPHFKLDGTPGQEIMTPSSAYLSRDRKSVFIGVPEMKHVMQMRFGWSLATADGTSFNQNAYFTVHELPAFEPTAEGFDAITVDLSPRTARTAAPTPVTAKEGERLAALLGCTACHSIDGSTLGKVGPSWKGVYGSEVVFTDGRKALANEAYLRESIEEPTAKILRGFDKSDAGMPSYKGVITDSQVEALILYIKTLK